MYSVYIFVSLTLPDVLLQSSLKELFSERQGGRDTVRESLPTTDIKQEGEKESGKMSQKQLEEVWLNSMNTCTVHLCVKENLMINL